MQHIGNRLKALRELAGLTQGELAGRTGMKQSALSRIEAQKDIRLSTLEAYVEGLGGGIQVSALLARAPVLGAIPKTSGDRRGLVFPLIDDDYFRERRDVIFSIRPKYSKKIESGEKTIELRRRFPANVPPGTVTLIYSTSPTCALTGVAEIEDVIVSSPAQIWRDYKRDACIEKADFDRYFSGLDRARAIKLRGARPLERSFELEELRERFNFAPPQSFLYTTPRLREALSHECAKISNRH